MEISKTGKEGVNVLTVSGKLDFSNSAELGARLREHIDEVSGASVVLDFSGVQTLTSAPLRAILSLAKRMHRHGAMLLIAAPAKNALESLRISGLLKLKIFELTETLEAAVRLASQTAPGSSKSSPGSEPMDRGQEQESTESPLLPPLPPLIPLPPERSVPPEGASNRNMSGSEGNNCDWEELVQLRACQLFKYRCPVSWNTLKTTGDPKVRFCDKCSEEVHFCDSESELSHEAALGHCAAIAVRIPGKANQNLLTLNGAPHPPGRSFCVLCASADAPSQKVITFDGLKLENEAFQAFSHRWVHAACLLNWKYRDQFLEAWNSALEAVYVNKKLFVSWRGTLQYTHPPHKWRVTEAEARRRAQSMAEREAARVEHEAANKARAEIRESRLAMFEEGCAKARSKAIAMGIATEENVNRILYDMPLADFKRDFGGFGVSRAFFH